MKKQILILFIGILVLFSLVGVVSATITSTLNNPVDGFTWNLTYWSISCTITSDADLNYIYIYGDWYWGWHKDVYLNLTGSYETSYTFNYDVNVGDQGWRNWNCKGINVNGEEAFAPANRTFFVNPEALDEMNRRVGRQTSANWGSQYMEDAGNNYLWQPETFMYEDVTSGREIWKMTPSANFENFFPDISFAQWSADGKRIVFGSKRATDSFEGYEFSYGTRMIVNANGSNLRPMPDSPARSVVRQSFHTWSPVIPDVYYSFGSNYDGESLNSYDLYKVTSTDTTDSKELLLTFPSDKGNIRIKKGISGDGTKIIANADQWFFPATVYPDVVAGLDDSDGYNASNVSLPYDNYWGKTAFRVNYQHDQYLAGSGDNIWFYILPENGGTWWRMRLIGSGLDGEPIHNQDHTYPYDWGGEFEPVNTNTYYSSEFHDPWCPPVGDKECGSYFSHFVPDRWGRIVAYSNGNPIPSAPAGPATYDMENNTRIVNTFEGGAQHHDWHAWSDWFTSSGSDELTGRESYANQQISTQKYDEYGTRINLASAHIAKNNGGIAEYNGVSSSTSGFVDSYNRLARPTQSPDGTKITYHSTFLNEDKNDMDIFYVVAYYPYPPEITQVNANSGTVTARFDWRLNTASPRGYTERGWPDEATDIPPAPREIEKFRLWRSPDGNNWMSLGTVNHNIFDRFDFVNGGFKAGQDDYWTITDNPGDGTWYYGITSIEPSGLESRTLSNIFQINVLGGSGTGSQISSYPTNPGEVNTFYTNEPSAPSDLNYVATGTPGHYQLDWTEPIDGMIRYYNIYYSTSLDPQPIQQNRIASVPKGTSEYLDWNAHQSLPGYYTITSVDYQGNEGSIFQNVTTCTLSYDEPICDCIDNTDLSESIAGWFNNEISISPLMRNIKSWKNCS